MTGDLLLCRLVYAWNATVSLNVFRFGWNQFPYAIYQKESHTNVDSFFRSYVPW